MQFNIKKSTIQGRAIQLAIYNSIEHITASSDDSLSELNCMQHIPRVVDLGVSNIVGVAAVKFKESWCG